VKLAANLSLLYDHLPWPDRFAAAAADGFRYVEILFPYDYPALWYAEQLETHGLRLVLINTPISPEFPLGAAAQHGAEDYFRSTFAQALAVCDATGCPAVHVMVGPQQTTTTRTPQTETLLGNLAWVAEQPNAPRIHLEALNTSDVPAYFYASPSQVIDVLRAFEPGARSALSAGSVTRELPWKSEADTLCPLHSPRSPLAPPGVGLQFDFYRTVKQGLSIKHQLAACLPFVQHVQIAGSPDRHEPELSPALIEGFRLLHEGGYRGFIGCEYRPKGAVTTGLQWTRPLLENKWVYF